MAYFMCIVRLILKGNLDWTIALTLLWLGLLARIMNGHVEKLSKRYFSQGSVSCLQKDRPALAKLDEMK